MVAPGTQIRAPSFPNLASHTQGKQDCSETVRNNTPGEMVWVCGMFPEDEEMIQETSSKEAGHRSGNDNLPKVVLVLFDQ